MPPRHGKHNKNGEKRASERASPRLETVKHIAGSAIFINPPTRYTLYAPRTTFYANPAAFFNAATLSSFSHGASMSVRPKCP